MDAHLYQDSASIYGDFALILDFGFGFGFDLISAGFGLIWVGFGLIW